jgi:hypothetical protein
MSAARLNYKTYKPFNTLPKLRLVSTYALPRPSALLFFVLRMYLVGEKNVSLGIRISRSVNGVTKTTNLYVTTSKD